MSAIHHAPTAVAPAAPARSAAHILVVHHDADLYGADQSLLRTLRALKASPFVPIVCVPHFGPLVDLIRAEGIELHIGPVGKLTRQVMKPLALPRVAMDMLASVRFMSKVVGRRQVVLTYTNSVAALGGALWAKLHRIPRLWHVREIVVAPKIAERAFPLMLKWLGGWCVCNSHATRQWIVDQQPSLASRSSVVWNGLDDPAAVGVTEASAFRERLGVAADEVIVTLVGRINLWKGQSVLIDAAAALKKRGPLGARFLIVGDVADGQHHFREEMLERIRAAGLDGQVLWHPFTPKVDVVWAASDIAVAPSIWPEPFGRVAIEAMSHALPVIATRHGGLAEIVVDEETGLLVVPGDVESLASALARLIADTGLRERLGAAGLMRQRAQFTQVEHDRKLMDLIQRLSSAIPVAA